MSAIVARAIHPDLGVARSGRECDRIDSIKCELAHDLGIACPAPILRLRLPFETQNCSGNKRVRTRLSTDFS